MKPLAAAPPSRPAPARPPGDEPDEDPRQLMAQLELVQREMQRAERRLNALEGLVADAQQAATTLRALADASGAQDVLIPVGGGVQLHAKVDPAQPALVPVGAGYATEGSLAGAAQALEARVQQASRSFQEAVQDMERLANASAALNERLTQMSGGGPE